MVPKVRATAVARISASASGWKPNNASLIATIFTAQNETAISMARCIKWWVLIGKDFFGAEATGSTTLFKRLLPYGYLLDAREDLITIS